MTLAIIAGQSHVTRSYGFSGDDSVVSYTNGDWLMILIGGGEHRLIVSTMDSSARVDYP